MERESLKEINEELRCSQAQEQQFSQAGDAQETDDCSGQQHVCDYWFFRKQLYY